MSADRKLKDAEHIGQTDSTGTSPETATGTDNDTEGHMMLPDRTSQMLARDRERDIRQHLSRRELERQAKEGRGRK
jgi:hypothetical protein